jgi:acetyltransferase-like isoleucine patch superfamily enzyme
MGQEKPEELKKEQKQEEEIKEAEKAETTEALEKIEKPDEKKLVSFSYKYFIVLFFLTVWLTLFPSVLFGYWFFITFPFSFSPFYLLLLIPLFLILYGIALLSSLFTTKIGIWIVHKRITPPISGSYPISMENPHFRAFIIKGNIKNFGRWLYCLFHLDFIRAFWLRRMGWKIGKNVRLGSELFFLDDEFIEIGDNSFFAKDITMLSGHLLDQTNLTIHPTIIGKNCIFKNISGAVGAKIGDNSILEPITGVMKGQICRGNAIYYGVPCKKVKDNNLSPEEIQEIKQEIQRREKINYIKKKNAPIKINEKKLFFIKFVVFLGGICFGLAMLILYSFLFMAIYSPTNHFYNILVLALIPLVFIVTMGFFVTGTTLFIKIFLSYYDKKAEIPEGTYELDDPRAKIFKIKYFLRLFGLHIFHGTPFKIADTFALRLWGNVKLEKNVKMEDAFIDPQYLEVGDYSQIALGARVHTHDIIDGKLFIKKVKIGRNVIIGAYTHIKPGVIISDGSVTAVAAWLRKNQNCKRAALWVGKPAAELPLLFLTKSARLEGKYVD